MANIIFEPSIFNVLRALFFANDVRSLREIAVLSKLSPRGASLVIDKLLDASLVEKKKSGKNLEISLVDKIKSDMFYENLFRTSTCKQLQKRAKKISKNSVKKIAWFDEMYQLYQE